ERCHAKGIGHFVLVELPVWPILQPPLCRAAIRPSAPHVDAMTARRGADSAPQRRAALPPPHMLDFVSFTVPHWSPHTLPVMVSPLTVRVKLTCLPGKSGAITWKINVESSMCPSNVLPEGEASSRLCAEQRIHSSNTLAAGDGGAFLEQTERDLAAAGRTMSPGPLPGP